MMRTARSKGEPEMMAKEKQNESMTIKWLMGKSARKMTSAKSVRSSNRKGAQQRSLQYRQQTRENTRMGLETASSHIQYRQQTRKDASIWDLHANEQQQEKTSGKNAEAGRRMALKCSAIAPVI